MAESDKQKKQKANFDRLYRKRVQQDDAYRVGPKKDKPTKEINTDNVGPYNRDIQRYDNPFERNNPNQMAADEKLFKTLLKNITYKTQDQVQIFVTN